MRSKASLGYLSTWCAAPRASARSASRLCSQLFGRWIGQLADGQYGAEETHELPDQDVPRPGVSPDGIGDAARVVPVAGRVDGEAEVAGQGRDGVVGPLPRSVCKKTQGTALLSAQRLRSQLRKGRDKSVPACGGLGHDVANVAARVQTEHVPQTLRPGQALGAQAGALVRLLAVPDQENRRAGLGLLGRRVRERRGGHGEAEEHQRQQQRPHAVCRKGTGNIIEVLSLPACVCLLGAVFVVVSTRGGKWSLIMVMGCPPKSDIPRGDVSARTEIKKRGWLAGAQGCMSECPS